jgi:hypothetical protein
MNNEQITTKKPLWRRILRKIFFAAIILIVLGLIACSTWNYLINRQIKTEIQKIRAAGQPASFEDWEAKLPKIDETQNAARCYNAAMNLMLPRKDNYNLWVENNKYFSIQTPQMQKAAKPVLEANRLSLELLDSGSKLPACRDELGIKNGIEKNLGKLALPRQVARLLSLRTRYLASQGNGNDAVDSVISALRFSRIFDDQPLLITYLVKIACQALAYQDIEYILQFSKPSLGAFEKLQRTLAAMENPKDFEKVVLGERVYGIKIMNNIPFGNEDTSVSAGLPEQWPWALRHSPFILQMNLGYLKDMAKFLEISRTPWPQVFNDWKQCHAGSIFGQLLQPAYQQMIINIGRGLAQERSTLVAIMVERYRRTHNENLPEKLADLVPAYISKLPLDPFTGKDLLYRHDPNSYTIYSLGDNLKDDRGDVESPPTTQSAQVTKQHNDWGVKIYLHPNK